MTLIDIWKSKPEELKGKRVEQLLTFAGDGRLRDGNTTSREFRELLTVIDGDTLKELTEDCLEDTAFDERGYALQDLINETGIRLGFNVEHGLYRGAKGESGHDGIWKSKYTNPIIIEVKSSANYPIQLNSLKGYVDILDKAEKVKKDDCSILIIVGNENTETLEQQVRGSKLAWSVRIIGVASLLSLLQLKKRLDNPEEAEKKIHTIFVPQEYTKIDGIVELVFSTTSDMQVQIDETIEPPAQFSEEETTKNHQSPVKFNDACIKTISVSKNWTLVQSTRTIWFGEEGRTVIVCLVSREHERDKHLNYWFGFREYQQITLSKAKHGYLALGCGVPEQVLLIPILKFVPLLSGLGRTEGDLNESYWHVVIRKEKDRFILYSHVGFPKVDLTDYLVK